MAIRLGLNQPQLNLPRAGANVQKAPEEAPQTNTPDENARTADIQVRGLDINDRDMLLAYNGIVINDQKSPNAKHHGEVGDRDKWAGSPIVAEGDTCEQWERLGDGKAVKRIYEKVAGKAVLKETVEVEVN